MTYPRCVWDLITYLTENPKLVVKIHSGNFYSVVYTYESFDGIRAFFSVEHFGSGKRSVTFPICGGDVFDYHEDGFARTVGSVVIQYYYTGEKPWQTAASVEWRKSQDEWDEILSMVVLAE